MYHVKCYRSSTGSICWVRVTIASDETNAMTIAQNILGKNWVACYCGDREKC